MAPPPLTTASLTFTVVSGARDRRRVKTLTTGKAVREEDPTKILEDGTRRTPTDSGGEGVLELPPISPLPTVWL